MQPGKIERKRAYAEKTLMTYCKQDSQIGPLTQRQAAWQRTWLLNSTQPHIITWQASDKQHFYLSTMFDYKFIKVRLKRKIQRYVQR